MKRILQAVLLLISTTLLTQCQKDLSYTGGPDPVIVTPDPITANLQGIVLDENGQAAAGVTVTAGSQTATTDSRGYFRIMNAGLDKKTALVTAQKAGYFKALRSFAATSGTNHVELKLIKKTLAGTIDAAAGGEASFGGSKVALQANGVVVAATNAPYTGTVNVYAAYIDPTAADIDQVIPGSLMATDKNGSRVSLTSYGMLAVELESTNGEKLQIKSGNTATLTTAIPASVQASAPSTIALWYVDETTGLWKEEGTATKNGNLYVGTVKHFSFWNCDVSSSAIQLSMTVKNSGGNPVVYAHVRIKRTTINSWASGVTDSLGQVSGLVPSNEALILQVVDACNNVIYTQNIGPFTTATNLGVITIPSTTPNMVTISGSLVNCTNGVVTNGYAIINVGGWPKYAAVNASGNFSVSFITCQTITSYTILGVDNTTQQQSASPISGSITLPVTNTGAVSACGTSSAQYINYTLDGTSYSINNPNTDSLMAYTTQLQGTTSYITYISGGMQFSTTPPGSTNYLSFQFTSPTTTAGTYPIYLNTLRVNNYVQGNTTIAPFNVVVTNFPTVVGDFYQGSTTGSFKDAQNVTHTLSVQFRLRKNF